MGTLSDRLRLVFDESDGFTPSGLARACGIRPPSVSDWLSGKTKSIRSEHLHHAANYLRVRAEWLATGQGPRERDTGGDTVHSLADELLSVATPRSRRALTNIMDAAQQGKLTDADMNLLDAIVKRLRKP